MSPYRLAEKFVGLREIPGPNHNPQVVAFIQRAGGTWIHDDETAWCSAFAWYVAWLLDLPRPQSKGLRARSWLEVGEPVQLADARAGDVVIFQRGTDPQPGPEVLDAPGHVAFYAGRLEDGRVLALGGNQGNEINVSPYPPNRVLGVRRLA